MGRNVTGPSLPLRHRRFWFPLVKLYAAGTTRLAETRPSQNGILNKETVSQHCVS
jgi:hypothetical protein